MRDGEGLGTGSGLEMKQGEGAQGWDRVTDGQESLGWRWEAQEYVRMSVCIYLVIFKV